MLLRLCSQSCATDQTADKSKPVEMCLPTTTQLIVQPGDQLTFSSWLTGSAFLVDVAQRQCYQEIFCLAEPNSDPELQSEITSLCHQSGTQA